MELLGKLGIDIKLLIAQILNFTLLLWILTKFLYKPIIKKIEEDEKELDKAKIQSLELKQKKEIFEQKQKKEIEKIREKVTQIINEAENIAISIKERAEKETKEEKAAVIKQIKSRLIEIEEDKWKKN